MRQSDSLTIDQCCITLHEYSCWALCSSYKWPWGLQKKPMVLFCRYILISHVIFTTVVYLINQRNIFALALNRMWFKKKNIAIWDVNDGLMLKDQCFPTLLYQTVLTEEQMFNLSHAAGICVCVFEKERLPV